MCQYLMAERFVKSILEYPREIRKDTYIHTIADVIMKRLIFLDEYANAKNDDRVTQQLRLLADVVACWMNEIIIEVDKIYRETLKEYSEKRGIRMLEVNDNDKETKIKRWKQIEQMKEKNNQEEKNEIIKRI